ncbi:hypothetical protein CDL15_Pgr015352 [Punica granatum]|uniref:Phytocyanin domain-containing protein n=1 Tax=Punica granatum TaxID=22663 RepID=A0A218VZA0_PUNGR|nr:hypothetical protein CDL15_Pgr015352 [Punica granatum]PKI79585.1 hypothetical protein CRG98_000060 [Punica granatum]
MMSKQLISVTIVAVVTVLLIQSSAAAPTTHVVGGDDLGWGVPKNPKEYENWADNQTFKSFKSTTGELRQVNWVTREAFDACDSTKRLGSLGGTPVTFELKNAAPYYFISTRHDRCLSGMKLAIKIVNCDWTMKGRELKHVCLKML